jgi:hypothetical protein
MVCDMIFVNFITYLLVQGTEKSSYMISVFNFCAGSHFLYGVGI